MTEPSVLSIVPPMVTIVMAVATRRVIPALATGTSFGTFAILMPIAIPLADLLGAPLPVTVAAVLSGGVFGDHASPVSDTTILSSMATGCDHASHVNTQLPYALITGTAAFSVFVLAGVTTNPLSGFVGLLVLGLLAFGATRAR